MDGCASHYVVGLPPPTIICFIFNTISCASPDAHGTSTEVTTRPNIATLKRCTSVGLTLIRLLIKLRPVHIPMAKQKVRSHDSDDQHSGRPSKKPCTAQGCPHGREEEAHVVDDLNTNDKEHTNQEMHVKTRKDEIKSSGYTFIRYFVFCIKRTFFGTQAQVFHAKVA